MTPPKPKARPDKVSLLQYVKLFRQDILSAQPARLYRAKMAEFRTPFFRSYLINEPDLVRRVLNERPLEFPKSNRIGEGLRPLLGDSVFLTNGAKWQAQRRIIDPAFEGGRLRDTFPAMLDAGQAMVARLHARTGRTEIEEFASHAAADVIFRALFSIPIENEIATQVFGEFRTYQRNQPILNLAAFVPLPRWFPRFHRRATRQSAKIIRRLIAQLTDQRLRDIASGTAPDDLATKIMTQVDPETGRCFSRNEMVDQVAIFFLAGHETSAAALAWAMYLLATHPDIQDRVASEAGSLPPNPGLGDITALPLTKNVFREALRLYPPVPMMVRETMRRETFRDRVLAKGSQIVISPWHLHRNERYWHDPDAFDPDRFGSAAARESIRHAFIPFSSGARVCPGAGFAMIEGPLFLALLMQQFRFHPVAGKAPVPVAHLTTRSKDGIYLDIESRQIKPGIS